MLPDTLKILLRPYTTDTNEMEGNYESPINVHFKLFIDFVRDLNLLKKSADSRF